MENEVCSHVIDVKVDGGYVISYCIKCGKILDRKPSSDNGPLDIRWESGLMKDNGGQILHD